MNEVTQIHLGRQPFTISVDAHHALQRYLHDIKEQVSDKDVVNEVELRMSELLIERGVSSEKVILPEDVDFLKQQLGDPSDFSDDSEASTDPPADDKAAKRLYRDTDHALIAGVAAGVSNYLGLDPVLVRIIFILLTIFSGGIGIVLYAVLWLAVPPAVSASEKLQMQGKSVTLESLKDSVNQVDLSGSAQRVSSSILLVINRLFVIIIKLLGIGFIIGGILTLLGLVVLKTYLLLHHGQLFQENLFPVGNREQWLVTIAIIMVAIVAVFLLLSGVATFKRKWPVRGWMTSVLGGLFLICLAAALALSADVGPRVRDRYQETLHTTAVANIQPFNKVVTKGNIDLSYVSSPTYAVDFHYSGKPDLSKIKVSVENQTLYVDATAFASKNCTMLCLFPGYDMTVQIFAPNVSDFSTPPHTEKFFPNAPVTPLVN